MAMPLDIFHMEGWLFGGVARVVNGNSNTALRDQIGFCSIDVIPFKVLGVDDAIAVWIGFVLGESGASKYGKSNTKGLQIEDSLL